MSIVSAFPLNHWYDLERYVAALYYAAGFQVFLQGGFRPDGGVDLAVVHGGQMSVVQCKKLQRRVGVSAVRELLGAMQDFRAYKAVFVSTSGFTEDAERFARRNAMQLISEAQLGRAIQAYGGSVDFTDALDYFRKHCPKCALQMVRKRDAETATWICPKAGCDHEETGYPRRLLEPVYERKAS